MTAMMYEAPHAQARVALCSRERQGLDEIIDDAIAPATSGRYHLALIACVFSDTIIVPSSSRLVGDCQVPDHSQRSVRIALEVVRTGSERHLEIVRLSGELKKIAHGR
jgi:hypothetical protein